MELILRSEVIKEIPDRWRCQYRENQGDKYQIWLRLKAEENLTEEKAEELIGNNSWSRLDCDECGERADAVVQLGQEPDYESRTACICLDCLKKAVTLAAPGPESA